MKEKKVHVLVGYVVDGKSSGIDKYLLRVLDMMKEEAIQFDFLTNHKTSELEKVFGNYHASVIEMPSLKHPIKQYCFLHQLMKKKRYAAAYFNISEAFNGIGVLAAHSAGIKKIIVHSHSSRVDSNNRIVRLIRTGMHRVFRPIIAWAATDYCACSNYAGEWMFPERVRKSKQYQIIHNPINVSLFNYNEEIRRQMRDQLALQDKVVIGHVGSYCYAKNNFFLLDIMEELLKKVPNAVLLAVGSGKDWETVKQQAAQQGILSGIRFLGVREDVPNLMQAMDFFVLPSRFEGQPIAALEAQAAGLMTFLSDTITPEVVLSENCMQLSIKEGGTIWADAICAHLNYLRNVHSAELFRESSYDESMQAGQIKQLFITKKCERKDSAENL